MVPYLCGASCFLTARAMEQVKVDLAYSKANVRICGMSSGMAYGQLGPTHHSVEDIAWTRILPNLTVIVPADDVETAAVMRFSLVIKGRCFFASAAFQCRGFMAMITNSSLDKSVAPRRHGRDYHHEWRSGGSCARSSPLAGGRRKIGTSAEYEYDQAARSEAILDAARTTKGIVTAEEGLAAGGLGGAVAEVLALRHPTPMRILGLQDVFAPTGSAEFLLEHFNLTAHGMRDAALELIAERDRCLPD